MKHPDEDIAQDQQHTGPQAVVQDESPESGEAEQFEGAEPVGADQVEQGDHDEHTDEERPGDGVESTDSESADSDGAEVNEHVDSNDSVAVSDDSPAEDVDSNGFDDDNTDLDDTELDDTALDDTALDDTEGIDDLVEQSATEPAVEEADVEETVAEVDTDTDTDEHDSGENDTGENDSDETNTGEDDTENESSAEGEAESVEQEAEPDVEPDTGQDAQAAAEAVPEPEEAPAPVPVTPAPSAFDDSTPLARELAEITRRRRALAATELPLPAAPRVFTVANQKGGVGKTTSTVNLAAALARAGARVLVIDLDPQGNASTALGVEHRSDTISVYDVIVNDEPMSAVVQKSPEFEGLYCVPATIHLAGAEIELVSLVAREQRLRTALDRFLSEAEEDFHYVFIDCPPSLGLLTINAFVAAREVLIPIQCEYYALEGLSQLLKNIQLIEKHLNPSLAVSTILLTMYDSRTNLANQVADDVRTHFPKEVLTTLIPRSVRISEAPSYGQSVISYDPTSPGSLSYLEAAAEIARRGAPS